MLKPTLGVSSFGSEKGRKDSRVPWQCAIKAQVGAGNCSPLHLGGYEEYFLDIVFLPSAGSV